MASEDDRDEDLEATLAALKSTVEDLEDRMAELCRLRAEDRQKIAALEEENEALRERVADLETQLASLHDVSAEATSKEEKIARVVAYAQNEANGPEAKVTVLPKTIKGVAGVSRRYAYDLVDDMIDGDGEDGTVGREGYEWALAPGAQARRHDADPPQKGVVVDLERLHDTAGSVNSFITRVRAGGDEP